MPEQNVQSFSASVSDAARDPANVIYLRENGSSRIESSDYALAPANRRNRVRLEVRGHHWQRDNIKQQMWQNYEHAHSQMT